LQLPRLSPQSFGGPIAEGLNVLAGTLREQELADDEVRVEDNINRLRERQLDLTLNEKTGYTSQLGKNAIDRDSGKSLSTDYAEQFKAAADELSKNLTNERQRQKFMQRAGVLSNEFRAGVMRHEAEQFKSYANQVDNGVFKVETENAGRNWNDPVAVSTALMRIDQALERKRQRGGIAAELVTGARRDLRSTVHQAVIVQALAAENFQAAREYFNANKDDMNADERRGLGEKIDKETRGGLVNQAADRIWNTLGPKSDTDPVNLDVMLREANKTFENDNEGRKMLAGELNERRQAHDYSARERSSAIEGGIWKQVIDRTPLASIRRSPEFKSLDGKQQATMIGQIEAFQKRNENDPGTAMAKFAEYWAIASDPKRLAAMSDGEIFAKAPAIGPELTKHLLQTKQTLLNKEDKVRDAKIDQDSFNYFAREAGLNPDKKSNKATLGELKYRLETLVDAEQRRTGKVLNREDTDKIIKKMMTEVPVKVTQPWYIPGDTTVENRRLYEVKYPQNIVVPPEDKARVVDALRRAGIDNPTDAQIREGYIQLRVK